MASLERVMVGYDAACSASRSLRRALCLSAAAAALLLAPASAATTPPVATPIFEFLAGADGEAPIGSLLQDSTGALYGTTTGMYARSHHAHGTVFKLTPPASGKIKWTMSVLYTFQGTSDGGDPQSGLISDPQGNLFGTMPSGVFELSPPAVSGGSWTESVIAPIAGSVSGDLVRRGDGALFGVTFGAGTTCSDTGGCGAVFLVTPPKIAGAGWTQSTIITFNGSNGAFPYAGLTAGPSGTLYGTTEGGGTNQSGTVFKLTPPASGQSTWTHTILYSFLGGLAHDGIAPEGRLVQDATGALYGTTYTGGTLSAGMIFKLTPPSTTGGAWTEQIIHEFGGAGGPGFPVAGLTLSPSGNFLGASTGEIFKLAPPTSAYPKWRFIELATLPGTNGGLYNPFGSLLRTTAGVLYGTAELGGLQHCYLNHEIVGCGGVYEVTP